jgi:hypothetical protein
MSAPGSGSTEESKWPMVFMVGPGIVGLGLYIWSAITVAQAHSASEDYTILKNTVPTLIAQTLVGTLLLYLALLMYVIQDLNVMIYILVVMVFLTFGLSYTAVAIAAMSR